MSGVTGVRPLPRPDYAGPRFLQQPPCALVAQPRHRLVEGQPLYRAAVGRLEFGRRADQKILDAVSLDAPVEFERIADRPEQLAVDAGLFVRLAKRGCRCRFTR